MFDFNFHFSTDWRKALNSLAVIQEMFKLYVFTVLFSSLCLVIRCLTIVKLLSIRVRNLALQWQSVSWFVSAPSVKYKNWRELHGQWSVKRELLSIHILERRSWDPWVGLKYCSGEIRRELRICQTPQHVCWQLSVCRSWVTVTWIY
jgi:hypothetical protein